MAFLKPRFHHAVRKMDCIAPSHAHTQATQEPLMYETRPWCIGIYLTTSNSPLSPDTESGAIQT
jgi:hypothetical protein